MYKKVKKGRLLTFALMFIMVMSGLSFGQAKSVWGYSTDSSEGIPTDPDPISQIVVQEAVEPVSSTDLFSGGVA